MSEDKYISQLLNNDKLSKYTLKQYRTKLEGLKEIMKNDLDWILDHPDETNKRILSVYDEVRTQKAYLSSICALFKHVPELKDKKNDSYTKYYEYTKVLSDKIEELDRKGEASEKQKKGYVEWGEIIKKREELSKQDFGSKEHLLLSLYTYIPPLRQDFNNVKFLKTMPFGSKANQGNFIVLKSRGASVLVLNEFKTQEHFKHYHEELPKELVQVIKRSLEKSPRDFLFVDVNGNAFEKMDSYIRNINRTLESIFSKPLTPSLIRHSFIVYERTQNKSPGEEEDTAKKMLHSIKMKNRYRIKVK